MDTQQDDLRHSLSLPNVTIRIKAATSESGLIGIAGTLLIKHTSSTSLQSNDKFLTCLPTTAQIPVPNSTLTLNTNLLIPKPPNFDSTTAARLAPALLLTAVPITRHFPTSNPHTSKPHNQPLDRGRQSAETEPARTILVTAGETLTAAAMIYLLKRKLENVQIYATCTAPDDDLLGEICCRLVEHGKAIYAIDGTAPGLKGHLKAAVEGYNLVSGMDVLVELLEAVERREELRELLGEGGVFVDREGLVGDENIGRRFESHADVVATLGRLLEDIPGELLR